MFVRTTGCVAHSLQCTPDSTENMRCMIKPSSVVMDACKHKINVAARIISLYLFPDIVPYCNFS